MSDSEPSKLDTSQSEERWRRFAKLPKPFQFSLRTLLIVVVLVSIASIWPAIKIHQARRAKERNERVAAIKAQWHEYGAVDVKVDEEGNVGYAAGQQAANNLLSHLEGQNRLHTLNLQFSDVSDDGLEHLKELTSLREIELQRSQDFTDAGIKHLGGLNNLENLGLNHTNITDAGLEHLGSLHSLKHLALSYTKVTDAGLEHLRRLTNLRLLTVLHTEVSDEGVKSLREALPKCKIQH